MTASVIDSLILHHNTFLHHILDDGFIQDETLKSALEYSLFPGGKRIRPLLVYLLGGLVDVNSNTLDVLAASVELTHTYSLIHDDLPAMDNDDFRRGKPSCHKAYDEATAILLGDGLQALAIELLLTKLTTLPAAQCITVASVLIQATGINGMIRGQNLDLRMLSKPDLTEAQLSEIHHLKTGKLMIACAEMVLAAKEGHTENWVPKALKTYTNHVGLVFQMQDDYLDCYAPTEKLGKDRSSDSVNQKTTYATLFSKHQLQEKIKAHFEIALAALQPFGAKAKVLVKLTEELAARHLD